MVSGSGFIASGLAAKGSLKFFKLLKGHHRVLVGFLGRLREEFLHPS